MTTTTRMAEVVTPTATFSMNQMYNSLNITFVPDTTTTLNSKHNIFSTATPTSVPKILYFGLGINGSYNVDDENLVSPYIPKASDMDLFEPIPLRCVPVDQDLSAAERENYRIRKRITINETEYFAYYLKKITISDPTVKILKRETNGDVVTYNLEPANLTPTPSKSTDTTGDISVQCVASLSITGEEFIEGISALYDGDMRRARISEIGLYSGEDRTVEGLDADGVAFNYTEGIYTQLAHKVCTMGTPHTTSDAIFERTFILENGTLLLV